MACLCLLETYEELAKAIDPRMSTLDDPSLGRTAVTLRYGFFSALFDVGLILSRRDGFHGGLTFVTRVGAQVLR
jgi:hypothetical protein